MAIFQIHLFSLSQRKEREEGLVRLSIIAFVTFPERRENDIHLLGRERVCPETRNVRQDVLIGSASKCTRYSLMDLTEARTG